MPKVKVMSENLANKIAAGEVIEKPASVIKELVENSIDAGATNIIVEVKNGGKSFIKITDNGKGIEKEDLPLAIERHATSKLKKLEDLELIDSFGFRGEALASIAAVSNMTIITKTQNDAIGTKMIVEAGDIINIEEEASKKGTTIIIEKLFFNVPVRYKFLKNDVTEFKYIKDILEKIAISNKNVSIKLINNLVFLIEKQAVKNFAKVWSKIANYASLASNPFVCNDMRKIDACILDISSQVKEIVATRNYSSVVLKLNNPSK